MTLINKTFLLLPFQAQVNPQWMEQTTSRLFSVDVAFPYANVYE